MKKNNGYKIDFANNTFTMNYTFAAAASQFGTKEFNIVSAIKRDFPQMTIIEKSGRTQKSSRPNKGLTYDHMKSHIKAYDNAEELLEMFDKVVEMSKSSKSPYKYVCDWFKAQFPKYAEIPNLDRKELIVKPLPLEDNENIA